MSKTSSTYPPDEFDALAREGGPSGAHRAPESSWNRFKPFLAVLVVCSVLAVGVVVYLDMRGVSPVPNASATPTDAAQEPTDPAVEPTDPGGDPAAPADPAQPADPADPAVPEDPGTPADPADPSAPEDPVAPEDEEVDTDIAVRVLNGTGRSGLAAGAAGELEGSDWSDVTPADYTGNPLDAPVVYYQGPQYQAEAREVASILGIDDVVEVPTLVGPVSVVLAGDYRG